MVLEESSSSRDIFTSGDVPPSDGQESTGATAMKTFTADSTRTVTDASAATTPDEVHIQFRVNGGPLRHYPIRFDRMPLQGLTRRVAFGNPGRTSVTSHALVDLMSMMEALNGRPLTPTEAEAVALQVSRKQVYTMAAACGGIVGGALLAFAKRKTFKFPFRKPKPVERYNSFPLQRAPLLTGQYSRAAWHIARGFAYVGVGWSLLIPLYDYMGRNAQAVNLLRDERTKNLTQEFGRSLQKAHREIQEDMSGKEGRKARGPPRGEGADQPGSNPPASDSLSYGEYYDGSQGGYVQDDNSPTSSNYPYSDTSSNTGVLSDAQMQSRTRSQRPSASSSDPSNRNTFDLAKVERQPDTFDSEYNPPSDSSSSSSPFFDDALPTAGNETYPTSPSSPGGSAWARVRQSANSNTSPSSPSSPTPSQSPYSSADPTNKRGIIPPSMRQSLPQSASARQLQQKSARDEYETSGNSFSFSQEGQERQLAKEQAQREFDRMVEAERRGEEGGAERGGGAGGESAWEKRRGS